MYVNIIYKMLNRVLLDNAVLLDFLLLVQELNFSYASQTHYALVSLLKDFSLAIIS